MPNIYKITPSLAIWEYSQCKCCFKAMVVDKWKKPSQRFPTVFGTFDRLTRQAIELQQVTPPLLDPSLPPGTFETRERWVKSICFAVPGTDAQVFFHGKTDLILRGANGVNGILDLKTSGDKDPDELASFYRPQPHIYAWSLEYPNGNTLHLPNVQHLGLVVSSPQKVILGANCDITQNNRIFIPIERNDAWFNQFLMEMVSVLENKNLKFDPKCEYCTIRENEQIAADFRGRQLSLTDQLLLGEASI